MQDIVNAISTVGFPIVMCIIMVYYYHATVENLEVTLQKLNDAIDSLDDKVNQLVSRLTGEKNE